MTNTAVVGHPVHAATSAAYEEAADALQVRLGHVWHLPAGRALHITWDADVAIPLLLAARGWHVIVAGWSARVLDASIRTAEGSGLGHRLAWYHFDSIAPTFNGQFDLAIAWMPSACPYALPDLMEALRESVKPGGLVHVDTAMRRAPTAPSAP